MALCGGSIFGNDGGGLLGGSEGVSEDGGNLDSGFGGSGDIEGETKALAV